MAESFPERQLELDHYTSPPDAAGYGCLILLLVVTLLFLGMVIAGTLVGLGAAVPG